MAFKILSDIDDRNDPTLTTVVSSFNSIYYDGVLEGLLTLVTGSKGKIKVVCMAHIYEVTGENYTAKYRFAVEAGKRVRTEGEYMVYYETTA